MANKASKGGSALTHIDASGEARMVDVSAKAVTRRVAEASCRVLLSKETADRLHDLPKGDAIVGDWSQLVIGVREDINFDIRNEGVLANPAGAIVESAVDQFRDMVAEKPDEIRQETKREIPQETKREPAP